MAAGDAIRTLLARFTADTSPLERSARQMHGTGRRLGDQFSSGFGTGIGRLRRITQTVLGFALVRGAVQTVSGAIRSIGAEAREAQKIGAQTEAVIKSMGASSWTSAAQIGALSEALSNKRGVDDELIQSGANVLLTFRNIQNQVGKGNDIFNQATAITHDMSVALGKDMASSALLVGKALNDPIKGLTALGRSGIQFTQQQKDQITAMVAAGDQMGAQKIILAELTAQFGGSAEAQATFGDKARVALANLSESIGTKLLPVADRFFEFMATRGIPTLSAVATTVAGAVMPYLDRFGTWLQTTGLPALQAFGTWLMVNVVPILLELGNAFATHVLPRVMQFGSFLFSTVVPALGQAFTWLNQNRTAIVAVAAVLGALVVVQKAHNLAMAIATAGGMVAWLTQMAKSTAVVAAATKVAAAVQWLLNTALFASPITWVIAGLVALGVALYVAWTKSETFRNIVTGAWNGIRTVISTAWSNIKSNVLDPWARFFKSAGDTAVNLKDRIVSAFVSLPQSVGRAFDSLKSRILSPIASVIRWINSNMIGNVNKVTKHFGLTIPSIPVPKYHSGGEVRGRRGSEQPAVLQGGEGVLPIPVMRRLGKRGFKDLLHGAGGRLSGLTGTGAHGDPFDFIRDAVSGIGSQIGDWLQEGAAFAMDKVLSPIVGAVGGVLQSNGGTKFFGDMITGMMRKLKDSAVEWARGKDAAQADTMRGVGALAGKPVASGWSKPIGAGYRIGRGSKGHGYLAQDLPAPIGTPIYAMHNGRVIRAADLTTSYGRHVMIQHPGTVGVYAHMSQRMAKLNDLVRSGQLIGRVGSTGNSTGPHLHVETRGFDPLSFLRSRGIRFDHGGIAPPGPTLINNQTGRNERLINADDLPVMLVKVFIGDREITDIVRVEVQQEKRRSDADLYAQGVH
jgi:murein DD-endopeptidase MepM/ murein hydrolase activator NlpD